MYNYTPFVTNVKDKVTAFHLNVITCNIMNIFDLIAYALFKFCAHRYYIHAHEGNSLSYQFYNGIPLNSLQLQSLGTISVRNCTHVL